MTKVTKNKLPESTAPLCVDLDGTLIKTDTLYESILLLISKNILLIFILPFWLSKGKAYFKSMLAKHCVPDATKLPYRTEVLEYIQQRKNTGCEICLVTAANENIAKSVYEFTGIFDSYHGSNESTNLKGASKAKLLCAKYGDKQFDYIGDSRSDLIIWQHCRKPIITGKLVNNRFINQKLKNSACIDSKYHSNHAIFILKSLRIHQWIKNTLIFIPLISSLTIFRFEYLISALYAFMSFSLIASAIYLVNDMLDIENDRYHTTKMNRPFANGDMNIIEGVIIVPVLILASLLIAINMLPLAFLMTLLTYLAITIMYSIFFKKIVLVDVITLSFLYTMRIISGAFATGINLSFWLLAFSMFLFTSLAILKRYSELQRIYTTGDERPGGRGYKASDIRILQSMGITSGYLSVLVFALYINSPSISELYINPEFMWIICPLLLYWIGRMWMQGERGNIVEDPVIFAAKDKYTYLVFILSSVFILLSANSFFHIERL